MEDNAAPNLPKRVVRTITLTQEDLTLLDGIERVMSRTGLRIKTDSKLIRAAIQVANASLQDQSYNVMEIAEKVVKEDGRSLSRLIEKQKKLNVDPSLIRITTNSEIDGYDSNFNLAAFEEKLPIVFFTTIQILVQMGSGTI